MQYLLCFWLLHFQLDDLLDSFHLYDLDPYNLRSLPFYLQNYYKRQSIEIWLYTILLNENKNES